MLKKEMWNIWNLWTKSTLRGTSEYKLWAESGLLVKAIKFKISSYENIMKCNLQIISLYEE